MIDPLAAHSQFNSLPSINNTDADDEAVKNINAATTVTTLEKSQSASHGTHFEPPFPRQTTAYEPEKGSLDKALEQLNSSMQAWATGMRFDIDPDTQRIVLTLVDNESGDVLRTVPSETTLAIAKMIIQFQGNGINTKA